MARRLRLGRVVVDTSVVIRAARAFRQQPPKSNTPVLRLVLTWRDDPEVFTWLYSQEILTEYREILSRLKVPRNAAGRFINLLGQCGEEVTEPATGEYSPDPKDDPFYHCALGGDADFIITDNVRDFPPVRNRKRPRIITPADAVAKLWP
jgi:predicted nucleic acid-binding protein